MNAKILEYGIQCVLLVLILAVLFPGTFLHGEMTMPAGFLFMYDPWTFHTPPNVEPPSNRLTMDVLSAFNVYYVLVDHALDTGEWPLWNNMQFTGSPLLANYQTAVFYPPRLLHRLFELQLATTIYVLFKFFLCGINAYICGRGLGISIGAARFLSVGWMLCLYNVTWCYWAEPDQCAWLPLQFLAIEFILTNRYRRGFALLAFSATPAMLAGHPESAFTMAAFLGLYFVSRILVERSGAPRKLFIAGAAWAVVLLICAVQLLPFLEYLPNSFTLEERPNSDEHILYSLPLSMAVVFWVPRFFGIAADANYWAELPQNSNYSSMFYVGIAPWIAVAGSWLSKARTRLACLVVPGAISLAMAFNTPLADAVKSLPLLSSTRNGYFTPFGLFAVLLLASHGIDAWLAVRRPSREAKAITALAFGIAVIPLVFYSVHILEIHESGVSAYVLTQIGVAAVFSVLAASLLILGGTRRLPRGSVQFILSVVLAADLLIAGRGIASTLPRSAFFPDTELTRQAAALEQPARVRVLPTYMPIVPPGFLTPYAIEQFHGYDGIVPARFMHYISLMALGGWDKMSRVCAVDQIWTRDGVPLDVQETEFVGEFEGVQVFNESKAFDRAFLVGRARVIGEWHELLEATLENDYDPAKEILADWLPEGEVPQTDSPELGTVRIVDRTTNTVVIELAASEPCYLVLADAYFPGWEASIDGEDSEVFPAYHAFRGVIVPKGEHLVIFEYRPRSFRLGMWISVVTLGLSLAVSGWILRRTATITVKNRN